MRYYKTECGYFYKESNKGLNKTRISKTKYDLHQKTLKGGERYQIIKNTELYSVKNNNIIYPIFLYNKDNKDIEVKQYNDEYHEISNCITKYH